MKRFSKKDKADWVEWLKGYGASEFLQAFLRNAHGAESRCVHCHSPIYLDLLEGGGIADWKTKDGDYGCDRSPETNSEGTGGHMPVRA